MDGLEASKLIKGKYPEIHIILVTAFMSYALDGYKVKASRFLLKDDLEYTVPECLDDIIDEIRRTEQTITYDFREGTHTLRLDELIFIETDRHIQKFVTTKGIYTIYAKLDELEKELSEYGVVRIHQSFLVNLQFVDQINNYKMLLKNGKELSVTKQRYGEVKKQFALYFS